MIPESVIFKCTKSAEELAKMKETELASSRGCLYPFVLGSIGIIALITYLCLIGVSNNPKDIWKWLDLIVFVGFMIIPVKYIYVKLFRFAHNSSNYLDPKYDNMLDKEFAWDAVKQQFSYKDKNRSFCFKSADIEKWVCTSNAISSIDIILIDNGEQIVLESTFNPDIRTFLWNNKEKLRLPRPSSWGRKFVPRSFDQYYQWEWWNMPLNPYVEKI